MVLTDGKQNIRRKPILHRIGLEFSMTVFVDRYQLVETAAECSQIKFLILSRDNPMHVIVAQTLRVVRHTGEMMELHLFRFFKVLVESDSPRSSSHPQATVIVGSNKASLIARVDRITFQIITMIDKQSLPVLVLRDIIDTSAKSSYPNTPVMVFVHTIHVIITQTVHIILLMTIAGQPVGHTVRRGGLGTDQSVTFRRNPDDTF